MSPQATLILDYLRKGRTLTPLIAHVNLGIASLTSRIAELRKHLRDTTDPQEIRGEWSVDTFNRRYMSYWLARREPSTMTEAQDKATRFDKNAV